MCCSVKHDLEVRPNGCANLAAGIGVISRFWPPGTNFHALETSLLDFGSHFSLSSVGNLRLIIKRIVLRILAWPDTGQIDPNAVLGPAKQLVNWLCCDSADGVPKSVLQTSPLHKPGFQVVFDGEE